MPELINDETVTELKDNKVVVKRTIIEEFEPQEYLLRIQQLEHAIKKFQEQQEDTQEVLTKFGGLKDQVEEINDKLYEESKKEREEAVKNEANDSNSE